MMKYVVFRFEDQTITYLASPGFLCKCGFCDDKYTIHPRSAWLFDTVGDAVFALQENDGDDFEEVESEDEFRAGEDTW